MSAHFESISSSTSTIAPDTRTSVIRRAAAAGAGDHTLWQIVGLGTYCMPGEPSNEINSGLWHAKLPVINCALREIARTRRRRGARGPLHTCGTLLNFRWKSRTRWPLASPRLYSPHSTRIKGFSLNKGRHLLCAYLLRASAIVHLHPGSSRSPRITYYLATITYIYGL